ncbi:uncharacterized protein LOC128297660 [Anopheles moucheti]|uniref:uncharacterized protein LOC128297660 n=1 Tax=Anopheles moucheti TaxID=186751 RepID=UPI0022F0D6C8|nr:uncharacterized protein LOC128297660 [Anopheles moucheti]
MSYRKTTMHNSRSCPQTPAPRKDGPRFPMSAAILETPSIMSTFRQPEQKISDANIIEPPPKQFVLSFASNESFRSLNESITFADNSSFYQPASRQNVNTSQALNGSFLDCSFASNYTPSSSLLKRKVPLANSTSNNVNTNRTYVRPSSSNTASGLKSFHRTGASAGLNDSFHSYTDNLSYEKPRHPAECDPWKYSKPANISKGSATSNPEVTVSALEAKASLHIVSGTIEHLQKTIREQSKLPLLLETVANVISIKPGTRKKEKVILLRHRNQGPVMQGIFYEIDMDLAPLAPGDLVRCVGRLQTIGSRLQILKIGRTTEQYNRAILRLQTVSAFATKLRLLIDEKGD